jgi:hypothetical protein
MKDLMKKFNMAELKPVLTPMSTTKMLHRMKIVKQLIKGSTGA